MGSPFTHNALTAALAATLSALAAGTATLQAWTPGVGNESATSGFAVDTQSRNDVVSFWHCVYQQSEGYENRINWTGSISSGTPGSTTAAFKNDVQRRINYYRAMAGMDANIAMTSASLAISRPGGPSAPAGTTHQQAAHEAALLLTKNSTECLAGGSVATGADNPHTPPSNWGLDTPDARNGAYSSNLAIGKYGPGAIDAYMLEDDQAAAGGENNEVGHRRYLFNSRLQEVATGDVTATGNNYYAANALYVFGNLLPSGTPQFVPWPNAGFIPEAIVPERWSLTYPGADFSSATVTITDNNGDPVPTPIVSRTANFADNTLVWTPSAASMPSAEFDDMLYNVTVSNIGVNGSPVSHSYTVTVINPNRLLEIHDLSGSLTPPDSGARYYFDPVEHAEEYEFDVSRQATATWTEGAEDATAAYVTDGTHSSYELRSSYTWSRNGRQFWDTGNKAFRLAFPYYSSPSPAQSFLLNRTLIPQAGAQLTFRIQRGYMRSDTHLDVQTSTNGGGSWTTVTTYFGNGNGSPDSEFSTKNISLTSTGTNTLVRFLFHHPNTLTGFYYLTQPELSGNPVGVFVDGISVSNCDWLESITPVAVSNTAEYATLDSNSAGGPPVAGNSYILRLRPRVGSHWFPYGPPLNVVPVSASSLNPYELWFRGTYPVIGTFYADYDGDGIPNGVEHVFGLNPMNNADATAALTPRLADGNLELSHAVIAGGDVEAEYSFTLLAGSWQSAPVTISGGMATVSIPLQTPACYLRWKVVEP